uniref:Regulator of microtubule dynamics protein 1 n=1 Tax=Anopheles maculatus TaxID=74869 RepID=A0A182SJ44_9DIPT
MLSQSMIVRGGGIIIIQRYGRLLINALRITKEVVIGRTNPTFARRLLAAGSKQKFTVPVRPLLFVTSYSLFSSKEKKKESPEITKMADEGVKSLSETIQHADQLFDENNFQEAYDLLQKYPAQETYEVKWRLARVTFSLSKPQPSPRKEELVREAFRYAEEALKLNDGDFASHKWYSILLDAKSSLDGIKERVTQLETVKKHMQRAPNFYSMNHLMLAKTYQALKQAEKAKEFMTLAASVAVLNEDDKQCKEEATKLLKKM